MHCGSVMDSLPCFDRSLRLSTPMGLAGFLTGDKFLRLSRLV